MSIDLPRGDYLVRCFQSKQHGHLRVVSVSGAGAGAGAPVRSVDCVLDAEKCNLSALQVGEGPVELTIEHSTDAELLVRIEQMEWSDQGVSAALCSTLQEFRDLFSKEFLTPGEELAIRSLTLMFSDLKGSTAAHEAIGDASAYLLVRDHFRIMRQIITDHRGAVFKTMGDAVMAAFLKPEDAVGAAIEIQRHTAKEMEASTAAKPVVGIRLGLHTGPCIAVTAQETLDYFGASVNLAARVQSQSQGGDIAISQTLAARPMVRQMIQGAGGICEPFEVELKGFAEKQTLFRVDFLGWK